MATNVLDAHDEQAPAIPVTLPEQAPRRIRWGVVALVGYVWVRVGLILASGPFEMPDTASYRAGQGLRPPLGAALLSWLPDGMYVLVSATVSTAGFAVMAWALWDARRPRWSAAVAAGLAAVSLAPAVMVYEHWLVPDSLLIGLSLLGLAAAWRMQPERRGQVVAFVVACAAVTLTKEAGIGVVVLLVAVVAIRRLWREALVALGISTVLFLSLVLPASSREGTIMWNQPADTQMTMERFRVLVAGLMWTDLSPELAEVEELANDCGMTFGQLLRETLKMTDRVVAYRGCDELFDALDSMSQVDVLAAHLRNPKYVAPSIEDGFYDNLGAMAAWSGAAVQSSTVLSLDRWLAGALALLPIAASVVALVHRRGRMLALVALCGTGLAVVAALVDPTSQDRHTIVFRVVAAAIAVIALTVATDRTPRSPACDPGA